ncbi:MAG: hypothetical protein HFJ60_05575 [Clostridia bacterium]|jgi:putative Mn2+ efflux pump MntP|nr:hypothetical protein [Clostridia bacterium]
MLSSFILAISSSIDSLGIGITYGIKNTKISLIGKILLFIISITVTYISIFLGNIIESIFPHFLTKLIGSSILIFMGVYICLQALKEDFSNIFNNPISSDLDKSKIIDSRESIFLAIALSLDSLCIGIGGSISNINLRLFPILVSIFQLFFLSIGSLLGKNINKLYKLPENIWSLISGILLIFIGLSKFFLC